MTAFFTPLRLENEIVTLLPLQIDHFEGLLEIARDPALWELSPVRLQTDKDILSYLEEAMREKTSGISIPFTIMDNRTGTIAGSTRYGSLSPAHKRLEIGWTWLGKRFQKSGLNRAAKFELLNYGFESLDLNRIELKTDALNMNSRNAILKLGAKEEGIFRNHMITSTGRLRDSVYFSILAEEWPELKERVFHTFR
jgi:RimJ/RimL family protein N-acetyltransferase